MEEWVHRVWLTEAKCVVWNTFENVLLKCLVCIPAHSDQGIEALVGDKFRDKINIIL